MNNSESFALLVNELLEEQSRYKLQISNFCKFLEQNDLMDKAFNLERVHIDNFFEYALIENIGTKSQVNSHIAALKALFELMIKNEIKCTDLYGHIGTTQYKKYWEQRVDATISKQILPNELLIKVLLMIDKYIERREKIGSKIYFEVLIARIYIKLCLLIPLRTSQMLNISIDNIKNDQTRHINYNGIDIKLPNNLRKEIISTIDYAEHKYNSSYHERDTLFNYLYNCIGKTAGTESINHTLPRVYKELKIVEMQESNIVGKKKLHVYPAECYRITSISCMIKNGVNIVYLAKLTGLDVGTLLSGISMNDITQTKDAIHKI